MSRAGDGIPRITLPNGNAIVFRSGEKPDNLYGEDVRAAVIDEASRFREDAFIAVRSTLTATRGPLRLIGNVRGRRNWFYRLARRAEAGARGMSYAKITAYDAIKAGILSGAEVAEAKELLKQAPGIFEELYLAEATDDGGNPFGLAAIRSCIMDPETSRRAFDETVPVCYGVDLARSLDWVVIIGLNAAAQVCRFDRWQRVPWRETKRRIVDMVEDVPTLVDMTGVGDSVVEDLQHMADGVFEGFKFTSASKQPLMESLARVIQTGDIAYPGDGEAAMIVTELEEFEYVYSRTGVKYSAPEGMHDDCVDALALARHHWRDHGEGWFMGDDLGDQLYDEHGDVL